jgi:hypothetical protein
MDDMLGYGWSCLLVANDGSFAVAATRRVSSSLEVAEV